MKIISRLSLSITCKYNCQVKHDGTAVTMAKLQVMHVVNGSLSIHLCSRTSTTQVCPLSFS